MKLFTRTFVAFFLTFFLAMAGFFLISFAFQTDPLPVRWQRVTDTLRFCAPEARVQTPAQFCQFLQRITDSGEVKLSLYQTDGTCLLGQAPPTRPRLFLRALRTTDMVLEPWNVRAAQAVQASDGTTLIVVGQISGGLPRSLMVPALRGLLALLAAVAVCYGLARSVSTPILALRAAVHRVAQGNFSVRVAQERALERRSDELGELARDFDTMTERLEAGRLAQRQLMADISHELRSPLARLSVALELARRKVPEAHTNLERIEREAERMNQLISELLTLTRLEAKEQALQRAPLDLVALVKAIASDADFEAVARGVRVQVVAPHTPCQIEGDEELLHRALENVVRNALRYTEIDSTVEVTLEQFNGRVRLQVRDHGPGVPQEALPHLFDPFWRVGGDRDRGSGGFGLGLAIANRAISLHGGTITAENAEGGGLRVTIALL